jgi:hypothetical protein
MRLGMKAPICRSRQAKLQSGSTCNNEDDRHELDSQPLILSKSEAIVDSSADTAHTSAATAGQVRGLPSLVWKYFAEEIREALIEVQQSMGGVENDRTQD